MTELALRMLKGDYARVAAGRSAADHSVPMERLATTTLFHRTAIEYAVPVRVRVTAQTPCSEVVENMRAAAQYCAVVVGPGGHLVGIATSTDVVERMTFSTSPEAPVSSVMSTPVYSIRTNDMLYRALALMRRHKLRRLPVVDRGGRPVALLPLERTGNAVVDQQGPLAERIAADGTIEGLHAARLSQTDLADLLLQQCVPAPEILAVITSLNEEAYRKVIGVCLEELREGGWGDPPIRFAVIVMGSGARGESLLNPDQDNGFVIADYPDDRLLAVDSYFYELARRMTEKLHSAGMRFCSGYVMATNPCWRKRVDEWKRQFMDWYRKPTLAKATLTDISVDFRVVYGATELVDELRDFVIRQLPEHHGFLQELERLQFDHDVAITPLGTLKREHKPGEQGNNLIDIKRKAIMPLVEGVRILALRAGIAETGTLDRLGILRAQNALPPDLANRAQRAFHFLTGLLLREHISARRRGRTPGPYLDPDLLSAMDQRELHEALAVANRIRGFVHTEFTGELF